VGERVVRGFLSGGLWGLVLGGVTVSGASLVGEQPARNDPPAEPQLEAPAVQSDTSQTIAPVTQTTAGSVETTIAPSPLETPTANVTDGVDVGSQTSPAALPETADVADGITPPVEGDIVLVDVTGEVPVLPNPQSVAPQAPPAEQPIDVDTASAEPLPGAAPDITDDAPVADAAPLDVSASPAVEVVADTLPLALNAPTAPAAPQAGDTAQIAGTAAPGEVEETTPATDESPIVVAIVDDSPATDLPTGTSGVRVNRLSGSVGLTEAVVDDADADVDEDVFPEGTPALVRYAADGANPDGRPEVSVVLMDDGSFDGAVAAVAGVAFPVTVMLNPSVKNATDRMIAYRAAGIEVGVLAALPASATAADVAIFFEAAFATLPETVAVLDAGEAGLQSDQDVITQAIAALSEDGRGLVTVSRGLNTALRTAEEQGVPTGVIFRNLDSEDQDARVIRRFMDQAAFRARQESGVVLLGQIRGETISALIQWGAANRANQVAIVPVSKVLIGE
jgi:polysaccharide deacetylase 2 family uncharacterized protein YibQ